MYNIHGTASLGSIAKKCLVKFSNNDVIVKTRAFSFSCIYFFFWTLPGMLSIVNITLGWSDMEIE